MPIEGLARHGHASGRQSARKYYPQMTQMTQIRKADCELDDLSPTSNDIIDMFYQKRHVVLSHLRHLRHLWIVFPRRSRDRSRTLRLLAWPGRAGPGRKRRRIFSMAK
jgi:hypothetical protein